MSTGLARTSSELVVGSATTRMRLGVGLVGRLRRWRRAKRSKKPPKPRPPCCWAAGFGSLNAWSSSLAASAAVGVLEVDDLEIALAGRRLRHQPHQLLRHGQGAGVLRRDDDLVAGRRDDDRLLRAAGLSSFLASFLSCGSTSGGVARLLGHPASTSPAAAFFMAPGARGMSGGGAASAAAASCRALSAGPAPGEMTWTGLERICCSSRFNSSATAAPLPFSRVMTRVLLALTLGAGPTPGAAAPPPFITFMRSRISWTCVGRAADEDGVLVGLGLDVRPAGLGVAVHGLQRGRGLRGVHAAHVDQHALDALAELARSAARWRPCPRGRRRRGGRWRRPP